MLANTIKALNKRHYVTQIVINDTIQAWKSIGFNVSHNLPLFKVGAVTVNLLRPKTTKGFKPKPGIVGFGLTEHNSKLRHVGTIKVQKAYNKKHTSRKLVGKNKHHHNVYEYWPSNIASEHLNRVSKIDHLVIRTQNIQTTKEELSNSLGLTLRLETTSVYPGKTMLFYREDNKDAPIIEVVGDTVIADEKQESKAMVWGITFVVDNLEEARKVIGTTNTSEIRQAKQANREICTLNNDIVGTNVAFMTPHVTNTSLDLLYTMKGELDKQARDDWISRGFVEEEYTFEAMDKIWKHDELVQKQDIAYHEWINRLEAKQKKRIQEVNKYKKNHIENSVELTASKLETNDAMDLIVTGPKVSTVDEDVNWMNDGEDETTIMVGGVPLQVTNFGPVVVNVDGTISRIENWYDMSEEQQRQIEIDLKERNERRVAALSKISELLNTRYDD